MTPEIEQGIARAIEAHLEEIGVPTPHRPDIDVDLGRIAAALAPRVVAAIEAACGAVFGPNARIAQLDPEVWNVALAALGGKLVASIEWPRDTDVGITRVRETGGIPVHIPTALTLETIDGWRRAFWESRPQTLVQAFHDSPARAVQEFCDWLAPRLEAELRL